ncbi:MAG: hypothetical protein IKE90_01020 [Bacilli bacterium]|nr:hypothetical protein [Bacilli bacterium]
MINFSQIGDRKVKVEIGFKEKIKNFFKNFLNHEEKEKTMGVLSRLGVKITSFFTGKTEEQILAEKEADKILKERNEQLDSLIRRLENEELTAEEIDEIVKECEEIKNKRLEEYDELIRNYTSVMDKDDTAEEKENYKINTERIINEAAIIAREKINDNMIPEVVESSYEDNSKDDQATIVGDINDYQNPFELGKNIELDEPDLDDDIIPEETNDSKDEVTVEPVEEPEIELPKDEAVEEKVEEENEPVVSKGIDITDEMAEEKVEIKLEQCTDWYDYVKKYFEQSKIDIKDVHAFYREIDQGNYPLDFYDKETFAIEKQRLEDERELEKVEREKTKTEKRLREIEEQQAALSEEHAELQARYTDQQSKSASLRKSNVSLKQELVDKNVEIRDKEQEISGLQGQLATSQRVAKKAQAQSYKDREKLSEVEKELEKQKKHAEKLERELKTSKDREEEIRRELEATNARISANTEAALKQINSLRDHDDIEKKALSWAITGNQKKEEKKGPKHFAEKKTDNETPKEETKKEPEKTITPIVVLPKVKKEAPKEKKVIAISNTPNPDLQGVVLQDSEGHIEYSPRSMGEIKEEREKLEAAKSDIVKAIEKEAEGNTNSNDTKTR